jgi:hypothetical protein
MSCFPGVKVFECGAARWERSAAINALKSLARAMFNVACVGVILTVSIDAQAECDPNAIPSGSISCGVTLNPTGYAATWYLFEFEANAGDVVAFTAAHTPGGGTLELAIQDITCDTTYASDGDVQITETATICPFVAPETSTYVLYVSALGRRFVPFSLSMICLVDAEDCSTVPVENRTWGHIKTLYR